MSDYVAWKVDLLSRLRHAVEHIDRAATEVENSAPPWTGLSEVIVAAIKELQIARADTAAARVAWAGAVHDATVAKTYDTDSASGDEDQA